MDNFLFKYNLHITFNHLLKISKTIGIVLPNLIEWLQDKYCLSYRRWRQLPRQTLCLTEWFRKSARHSICLTECFVPRQLDCLTEALWCLQDNLKLSGRMSSAKTIQDCLAEWLLQDNCNCLTEVLDCLTEWRLSYRSSKLSYEL